MKVAEILRLGCEMLRVLHKTGIKTDDYRWLQLYADYQTMKREGEKTTYVVAILAERYAVCERKVYKIIRCMERECQ